MSEGQNIFEGFWSHINEFIKRMKVVLGTFLVALIVMLVLPGNSDFFALTNNYKPLMSVLLVDIGNMFLPAGTQLFAGSMSDPITLYVYAALVFAVGITLPIFAYEAYMFIDPALYPHERKSIFPFVAIVTSLFIVGAIFGFFFLAPAFVQGFIPFYSAVNAVELFPIMDFYGIVFFTIIISGVLFMIPAFFVLLVKFNILHTKSVTKQRKYIYAGIAIAAMLISPGATPQGDFYLFLALAALIEVSVFVGKRFENKNRTSNSQSLISKWFSPVKICKFCNSQLQENANYCSNCKRFLA
ncbi:MAG: twin-arginine translocase subunit TatC [Ignavibacteria bacterium]